MNNFNSRQTLQRLVGLLAGAALVGVGCSPGGVNEKAGSVQQAHVVANGMDDNGYDDNGMDDNGLDDNGLNAKSLAVTEFDSANFENWIHGKLTSATDPENELRAISRAAVMGYIVRCALDQTDSLSWSGTIQGVAHSWTWNGNLNLIPQWKTAGHVLTTSEHETLDTCLAAHVNADLVSVPISVRGLGIRMDTGEDTAYTFNEGAYFVYTDYQGVRHTEACHSAGNASLPSPQQWNGQDSRRCGRVAGACPHVVSLGDCSAINPIMNVNDGCTLGVDGNYSCVYNGVARSTVTVYLSPL